jgi:hypothetical protein
MATKKKPNDSAIPYSGSITPQPRLLRGLLPFGPSPHHGSFHNAPDRVWWQAEPQMTFRPAGLMMWGVPPGAFIEMLLIGPVPQLIAAVGPIPAEWFTTWDSYDAVFKAHQEGKDPPGWGDFQIMSPGMYFRVEMMIPDQLKGQLNPDWASDVRLLCWGHLVR